MDFRRFNEVAELVGIAAIVASLVFVGLQMKQASDIAKNEVSLGVYATGIEINNEFSEYADIWIRGSRGDELDETEAFIFGNLIQNLNSHEHHGAAARNRAVSCYSLGGMLSNYEAMYADLVGRKMSGRRRR